MSKYKVGDVVVIRSDLYMSERYGKRGLIVIGDMVKYRGMTREISKIDREFDGEDTWYRLTDTPCLWSGDMFAGLADDLEPAVTVIIPDTAQLNDRLKAGDNFLDMFTYE